jgi:hypothetical protein
LGCDQNSTSTTHKTNKKSISHADSLRNPSKREDNKMEMALLSKVFNKWKSTTLPKGEGNEVIRRTPPNRYQCIFFRYCYSCNNFGNKEVHYKAYIKYKPNNVQRYKNNQNDVKKINYNSFSPL